MIYEYFVIGGYLVFLVAIGFAFRKFNSNVSDYFRNGCRGTWWLVGSSAFMQMFSAWTFTGAAGAAFESGWSVMIIFIANVMVLFMTFLFLGPWFRQLRAVTAPEVIRLRFGTATQQLYAWLQGALGLLYASIWLWGLATFIAAVFDFTTPASALGMSEIELVIVVTGLVVLAYSVSGGSWAVMATDFVQSLILIPLTLLVAFLCLREIGGIASLFQEIESQGLSEDFAFINAADRFPLGKYGIAFAIATVLYKTIAYSTLITAQKYFGVKDGREARKAGLLACILMLGGMLFWFIPPVVARLTMADEVMAANMPKPAEASYAMIAVKLLPTGMTGLIVVAMLAATMSSMDSGINRNAGVFVRDIEPVLRRAFGMGESSEKLRFILSQVASVILGITIIGLALYFSGRDGNGVFEWMLNIGAVVALPMSIPMFLALFVRRAPAWSALTSIIITLIPAAIGFLTAKEWFNNLWPEGHLLASEWSYQAKVFTNVGVGVGTFLLTTLFWGTASQAYRAQVREFFHRMHTPVDFEREVGAANDSGQLRIIGGFSIAIAGFVALIALIPGHDTTALISILFVVLCVGTIGGLLLRAGLKQSDTPPIDSRTQSDIPLTPPNSITDSNPTDPQTEPEK